MDVYSTKRGVSTSKSSPRQGFNVGSKEANSGPDQNVHFCNRIGCNGRVKYANQSTKTGSSEKAKSSPSSFCYSNANGANETSSMSRTKAKSSYLDPKRKLSSQLGFDKSESSHSQSGNSEATESTPSPISTTPTSHHSGSTNESGQAKNGIVPSSVRSRNRFQYTTRPNKQNTNSDSAVPSSSKRTLHSSNSSTSLKSLKCDSVSDSPPSSCSSSRSKSPSKNAMKKRSLEGDSRWRQASFVGRNSSSSGGASTSDPRRTSCTSGAGGSANVNKSKATASYRESGRNTPCFRESSVRISHSEPPRTFGRPRLPLRFSANASSSGSSSYSVSSSNDNSESTLMPYASDEHGFSRLVNRGMLQRYNMDGTSEVLLALERIEQEEMTHAQILALETSLFLSGLNLYDQHRDMRLDIDSMSYEELLALGDRMGTVSTALSEEELSKGVKRSIYHVTPPEVGFARLGKDGDDVKCSICQEDYVEGDEIGKLVKCQHAYHVDCVSQWLRLKNWCPICKTAASPSQPSSSS